jgi:WD40 repeat protein
LPGGSLKDKLAGGPLAPAEAARLAKLTGHREPLLHLAYSPDSRHLASGHADGTVRVWYGELDAATWELRKRVLKFLATTPP